MKIRHSFKNIVWYIGSPVVIYTFLSGFFNNMEKWLILLISILGLVIVFLVINFSYFIFTRGKMPITIKCVGNSNTPSGNQAYFRCHLEIEELEPTSINNTLLCGIDATEAKKVNIEYFIYDNNLHKFKNIEPPIPIATIGSNGIKITFNTFIGNSSFKYPITLTFIDLQKRIKQITFQQDCF